MAAISTDGLTKQFGEDVLAVHDLDLTIEEGEIFGFLGPNGAGKSTTINMLLDFIRPTAGSGQVLGLDAQQRSREIRRNIGVLPEGFELYERLTGREHVEWVIDTKDADDDPDEILQTVGLADDADRAAGGYSTGMGQRLAFGMALVGDPDLLILDEPSSGLDPNGIQQMRRIIRERAENGTTVFFSSHILSEVEAVCDRVGIMNQGELVTVDTIEGLREAHGGAATIELECTALPQSLAVHELPGVEEVTVDGMTITAHCADPEVKVDVVEHVAEHTDVLDILSKEASLEELFNSYTGGGRDAQPQQREEPADTEEVTA
jgi:ABC-2 type transport system ATP-binding protein